MTWFKIFAYASAAGILLLGGCSAGAAPAAPVVGAIQTASSIRTSHGALPDVVAGPRMYVSDFGDSIIYVYKDLNSLSQPTRIITNGISNPQGLAVDYTGQLYVANEGPAQDVTVYRPGSPKPVTTYPSQYFAGPYAVAIGVDGMVYIANNYNGTVVEFPPGQVTPSLMITLPGSTSKPAAPQSLALDASNNLYVSYNGYFGGGHIEKYPPGSTSGVDLGIALSDAGGIALDKKGNIVVCDRGMSNVDVFPPGSTTPSQVIGGFTTPNQLAFTKSFKELVVTDPDAHNVDVLSYPAGSLLNQSPMFGYRNDGIALAPAAPK
jgi:hypothetical protein